MQHKGFSFLQVYSPCVTFYDTYDHFKEVTKPLPADHNPGDKMSAMKYAMDERTLYLGVYYQEDRPTFDQGFAAKREKMHAENYGVPQILTRFTR